MNEAWSPLVADPRDPTHFTGNEVILHRDEDDGTRVTDITASWDLTRAPLDE